MYRINSKTIFPIAAIFFVVFFALAVVTKGHGFTDYDFALITIASFTFGIFITFSILNNQDKLNKVNELLKTHDSTFLLLYKLSGEFDERITDKCRELIDQQLIDEIDYRLVDFNKSSKSYYQLYDYLTGLEPKTEKQDVVYDKMLDILDDTAKARQEVEVLTRQKISIYEWFSIITLLGLVCFLVLRINTGTILSSLLISVLATTMVVLTLLLQMLNNLRWQESTQIWEPLHNLFLNLDLLPYYPDGVIELDRYVPKGPGKIRVAKYPKPYPDMTGKTIEVFDITDFAKS